MSALIPSTEPLKVNAGSTIQWQKALSNYPASEGWSLSYSFVSTVGNRFDVASAASGSDYLVTISAATSALIFPGVWTWQSYVTKASERFFVDDGQMEFLPDYSSQTTTLDTRSHAKKCLDLIMAAMEGRLPSGLESYNIGGVDIRMIGLVQLRALYDQYRADVIAEEQAEAVSKGMGSGHNIFIRFNRP